MLDVILAVLSPCPNVRPSSNKLVYIGKPAIRGHFDPFRMKKVRILVGAEARVSSLVEIVHSHYLRYNSCEQLQVLPTS